MTLEDVVKRVEEFQSQNDRHFGILNTDFRTLFAGFFGRNSRAAFFVVNLNPIFTK